MRNKNFMTNEELSKRFDNPFTLVNYAISLAKTVIGRGESMDTNPAVDVLSAIEENRDSYLKDEALDEEDDEEIDIDITTIENAVR